VSRAGGNLSEAARLLGMTRPQLAYRLKHRNVHGVSASATDLPPSIPTWHQAAKFRATHSI